MLPKLTLKLSMIKSKIKLNLKLMKRDLSLVTFCTMTWFFPIYVNGCSREKIKTLIFMIKIFLNKMHIF
jgi:hypothetical protein